MQARARGRRRAVGGEERLLLGAQLDAAFARWLELRGGAPRDWYDVWAFTCWMMEHEPELHARVPVLFGGATAQDHYTWRFLRRGDGR